MFQSLARRGGLFSHFPDKSGAPGKPIHAENAELQDQSR